MDAVFRKMLISVIAMVLSSAAIAEVSEEVDGHGRIDWTNQTVCAVGISVQGGAGGRAGQIRAAELDALRQILETLKGIRINSETTVDGFMLDSDRIRSRIEGVAHNFHRVGDPVYQPDGSIELTVEMNLAGPGQLFEALFPVTSSPAAPVYTSPPAGPGVYTGLIVDARGLGLRPALAPQIVDQQGQIIYGERYVDHDWLVQNGMAEYARDLTAARGNERVGANPLVIEAVGVQGTNRTDVMISNNDARLLHAIKQNLTLLQQARVIFLVD